MMTLFTQYLRELPGAKGANETLAIARSNRAVQNINREMRRELFGDAYKPVQIGEILAGDTE
jgi:hypothetical protein